MKRDTLTVLGGGVGEPSSYLPVPTTGRAYCTFWGGYAETPVVRYTYTDQRAGAAAGVTAVAQVTSTVRAGIGGERVRWVALRDRAGHDLTALAQAFPAYALSLDPRARDALTLPPRRVPAALQGPVDDLLTFFVDLSARVGIARLHRVGTSYTDPDPLTGNFASATAPVGRDVIELGYARAGSPPRRCPQRPGSGNSPLTSICTRR